MPFRRNVDYKVLYNTLKKKFIYLLYENEFYQENLRTNQRRLLKVTRDGSFVLNQLLQCEKTDLTLSESADRLIIRLNRTDFDGGPEVQERNEVPAQAKETRPEKSKFPR